MVSFYNQNCSDAFAGCNKLGLDVVRYKAIYSINDNQPEDLVVGSYSIPASRWIAWEFIRTIGLPG